MPDEIVTPAGAGTTAPAAGADSAGAAPSAGAQPEGAAAPEAGTTQPQAGEAGVGEGTAQDTSGQPPPAGDSAAATRIADAQRLMHQATEQRATLRKALEGILGRQLTPAEAAGRAPITAPGTQPPAAPQVQPPAAIAQPTADQFTLDEQFVEDLYGRYSDPALDEKGAFKLLVAELGKRFHQDFGQRFLETVRGDGKLLDAVHQHIQGQTKAAEQTKAIVESVEAYWKKVGPQIPVELCWAFANEAERTHPNNMEEQAFYCLSKAIEKLGPALGNVQASSQAADSMQRGQEAVLPGGAGLPTGGGAERLPSMVDQMRRHRGTA